MTIHSVIRAWFGGAEGEPHSRYRSWEHCYRHFQDVGRTGIARRCEEAALRLAFYLASWGMYRGSTFALQYAYTIHCDVVRRLAEPRFAVLWDRELGAYKADHDLVPTILAAVDGVRTSYKPFGQASDTLVTKVLLGTLGCLPACDKYFVLGFKREGHSYSWVNERFVDRVLRFSRRHLRELRAEQAFIRKTQGVRYPLMKLVDMYFHQRGF